MPFAKTLLQQSSGLLFVAFIAIIGGTWLTVKLTTDHLLYEDATSAAQKWAAYLTHNVGDLEQIAAGEHPSAASMAFFRGSLKGNQVFRYEIYNRHGYSLLVAHNESIGLVDISDHSDDASRAIKSRMPVVDVKEGSEKFPPFYGRAYVPVFFNERPVAIVAAYVDQTEQRDRFSKTFLIAATALCTLVALAFGIPAAAWYRRTREKQRSDRRLRYLAHHDVLTGLLNRNSLMEGLNRSLAILPATGQSVAVHFIDIDRFKTVNDTLGHDGGDNLLKTVAQRLRASIPVSDNIARFGGDEFVVVQTAVTDKADAERFAQRLASALTAPVSVGDQEIVSTVSIGVALAPEDGKSADRLLKSADLALYKSKSDGRQCVRFFSPEMDTAMLERVQLEKTLREALARDLFELHFQPIFAVVGRELAGFEALIRLRAADGTFISPQTFIPVAEDIRLIDKIGAWVLREACKTAATWPDELTVAVNLSAAQFATGGLCVLVSEALKQTGLEPRRLELEITETLLLGDTESTMLQLQILKEMGIAIVMDDFGTGYSSLSYLWRFPFDKIKIDRGFMLGSGEAGRDAQTVVKTIIALGRELKMRVTVEGVETPQQVEFLNASEADLVQGFYFGRPMPVSELAPALLKNFQQRTGEGEPAVVKVRSKIA